MASPISNWTKEREAILAKLWAEGESGRQIAAQLGVTRNAILGKVYRLGLSVPVAKRPVVKKKRAKRSSADHAGIVYRIGQAAKKANRFIAPRRKREEYRLRCVAIECTTTFEDVTGCRYSVGDGPFLYCDGPQMEGSSWCVSHHALCHEAPRILTDKAPLREVA